jgi:hypothetical protein
MGSLKRKIQALEIDIEANQQFFRVNSFLLHQKLKKPMVLGFSMVTGFAAGYFIGAKFDKKAVKEHLSKVPSRLGGLFEHLKFILPLLPL